MPAGQRPTVRALRLGSELRRLREVAGITQEVAAVRIDGKKPKVSKIESGRQTVTKAELEVLLLLYGVTDTKLISALDALRATRRRPGWWDQYGAILGPYMSERLVVERDAVRALAYQPLLVPGLLQTADYARAVIQGVGRPTNADQVESYVSVRQQRQREFFEGAESRQCVCVLDEAVLHRVVGSPAILAAQLQHLVELNAPPRMSVQIISFNQGWHPGLDSPFMIYAYPDLMDLDVVVLEYLDGALYLEEDEAVDKYRLAFDELRALALSSRQSMEMISRRARDLEQM